jgi:hypothetical protein
MNFSRDEVEDGPSFLMEDNGQKKPVFKRFRFMA